MFKPEGTYLVWLDFREYGLKPNELKEIIINEGKLGFSDGPVFGKEGRGFQRINVGCPLSTVQEAAKRLVKAMDFAKK
jgi:cystathionine beta-lyase